VTDVEWDRYDYDDTGTIIASYCWCHDTREPVPPNPYVVCFECGHVYATPDDLVAAYRREVDRINADEEFKAFEEAVLGIKWVDLTYRTNAEEIVFCQECCHDF